MNAVVFGGSGFLGSHVADALSDAGYHVKIFDLKPSPYLRSNQEMIIGNILDSEMVNSVLDNADYVYNFSGIADLDDAHTKPSDTILLNIFGNAIILEAAVKAKCKRFIYASSIYVYSEKGGFYRCSKQSSELFIEEYFRRYGLDYTILRYGTIYGTRADHRNSVYRYLYKALNEGVISVRGQMNVSREYIHVRDAAVLSVQILDKKYINTHVTLTGQHPTHFRDLLYMIKEIFNGKVQLDFIYSDDEKDRDHYSLTPYSYVPKVGYKLTSNRYIDLGQGLLECIEEIQYQISKNNESIN